MFAKKVENHVNKVEMDWEGTAEDFARGYMEMANINQEMANAGTHVENEAEELLLSVYGN
ncbi:MAG: hypothetical protein ACI35O_10335 [Bacillaceae bacterium]